MEFFKAVALRDGRCAAECTLRLSNKQSCPYPEDSSRFVCNLNLLVLRLGSARTSTAGENDIMEIYIDSSGGYPKAHKLGAIQRTIKYEILPTPTKSSVFKF